MTIEALLGKTADELEKLTDAELQAYFEPMLNITRPDRMSAIYSEKSKSGSNGNRSKLTKKEQFLLNLDPAQQAKFKKLIAEDSDMEDIIEDMF